MATSARRTTVPTTETTTDQHQENTEFIAIEELELLYLTQVVLATEKRERPLGSNDKAPR